MTDNPHITPQRQPDDADAARRSKTLAEFGGQAAAREPYCLAAAMTDSMELS